MRNLRKGLLSSILIMSISGFAQVQDSTEEVSVKEYIDSTSLAVFFMNLFAVSVGLGLSMAMDTHPGWRGARKILRGCGQWVSRQAQSTDRQSGYSDQ